MFYYWLVYYKETDIFPINSGQPAPDFISQVILNSQKTISISESPAFVLHADI